MCVYQVSGISLLKIIFLINFIVRHVVHFVVHLVMRFVLQFCAVLWISLVQFYLRAWENKFHIVTCCKYIVKYILWRYVHFRIFTFACIYYLPCLFKKQWNVYKDKAYMKMNVSFLEQRGGWCNHHRCIQNPVKCLLSSVK